LGGTGWTPATVNTDAARAECDALEAGDRGADGAGDAGDAGDAAEHADSTAAPHRDATVMNDFFAGI
jgi:hypothetical protein